MGISSPLSHLDMRKIDLLNGTLFLLLILFFAFDFSWYFYLPAILLHLCIIAFAASNIQLNFFLTSFNRSTNLTQKTICLTFDDGPDPILTPQIISILREFNAKAAFFVIGKKISNHQHILEKLHAEGHLIGNHSYSHSNLFPLKSAKEIEKELIQTSNEIFEVIGKFPQTFRPPFGVTNPGIAKAIKNLGWHTLGWNIRSFDTKRKSPEITLQRVIKQCKPGSMVLFHDNIPETPTVIREFLVFLNNNNYKIILPDEMFGFKWYKQDEIH